MDGRYQELLRQIEILVGRGGKRMRPQLVIKAYEAYGGTDRPAIVKAAASQELFHAFILMHDDIIDRDLVRWGGPNITGHYLEEFSKLLEPGSARQHADNWALLAGDICFGLSYETLTNSGFKPARLIKALQLVQQALFTVVGGEMMDVALSIYPAGEEDLADEHFIRLCNAKTSCYSFCMPLRLGALLAGASASQDKHLNAFGRHIGVAFQLRDDMLGIYGSESQLGKPILSDLREGKQTMLMSHGLRLATPPQRQKLESILGNPNVSHADLKTIQKILINSGAKAEVEAVMEHHIRQARAITLKAGFPKPLNDYLVELLAFSVKRSR